MGGVKSRADVDEVVRPQVVEHFSKRRKMRPRPRLAVSGVFALGYGCARFFTEYFRIPDYEVHFAGVTISAGQMLSVPMIVLGLVLLIVAYRRQGSAAASAA